MLSIVPQCMTACTTCTYMYIQCLLERTHDSGYEGNGVLGREESEEPRSCIVEWSDVVAAQVAV